MLACADCNLPYGGPGWADFVVADHVWKAIVPSGDGLVLCVTCMFRRMENAGIDQVEGEFTSGPCAKSDWKKPATYPPCSEYRDQLREMICDGDFDFTKIFEEID